MSKRATVLSYIVWGAFTASGIGIITIPSVTRKLVAIIGDKTKEVKSRTINYKKLYGHWLVVAMRNTGDTAVADYFSDTLDVNHSSSILSFDSAGEWNQLHGDVGSGGRYKVDSINNTLVLLNVNYKKDDTVSVTEILYLGKRCMLLQDDSNKKATLFYLRTDKVMIGMGG